MIRLTLFLCLCLLGLLAISPLGSQGAKPKNQAGTAFPADTPQAPFSKYNSKSKLLKFSKYVEKPIPLKVWIDTSAFFFFSDTATKDRFRFSVIGDYDYNATAFFQILAKNGTCIYKDSFSLLNILAMYFEGGGQYATRRQKETALSEYAENLLSSYSLEGALEQLPSRLEPDFTIHENYKILTMDEAQLFFVYSKRNENYTFIGYDPVLGYALVFYDTQY